MKKILAMVAALIVIMFAAFPQVAIAENTMKTKCYLHEDCDFLVGEVLFQTYCEKLGAKSMKQIDPEVDVCVNIE